MDGAEFLTRAGVVQVLQAAAGAQLLLDPFRGTWLPWGRRPEEPGDWPAGGVATWSSIYRPAWQRWAPERVLLRPQRWRSSTGSWAGLRPGFAILALKLQKAPATPLYVVTLDGGAPKLMPRIAEWEANREALERAEEARQKAAFEEESERGRQAVEIFLLRIEPLVSEQGRDVVKAWDKDQARRWWAEVVSVALPQYAELFELFWELNDSRRWVGPGRF